MMKTTKVFVLVLVLALLVTLGGAAGAQEPQPSGDESLSASTLLSTGCVAGGTYDPACDVNHDDKINIVDIELTASHWGQTGTWTSDNWSLTGNSGTTAGTNFLGTTDNQPLIIKTNGAEVMRADTNRNVGIGTTNPSAKLHVIGDEIQVEAPCPGGACLIRSVSLTSDGVLSTFQQPLTLQGAEGTFINPSGGNVGIGTTTSPAFRLDVVGNRIRLRDSAATGAKEITLRADGAVVDIEASNADLFIKSTTGDTIMQPWSGNVGIGTASPQAKLHVNGGGTFGLRGVQVNSAGSGLHVKSTGCDGVYVERAGNPSGGPTSVPVCSGNGIIVERADSSGLYVAWADVAGVYVNSAYDGVFVRGADRYAGVFTGDVIIIGGSCTNCASAAFGRNAGQTALEPGDAVAIHGVIQTGLHGIPVVMNVGLAAGPDAVIGVVAGRAKLDEHESSRDEDEAVELLVPREGPAQPGEYVSIVINGMAQVKVSAVNTPIQPGTRLTAADSPGHARAVQTVEVQGVRVAESAPIIGIALEKLEAGQGLIWVLVNPR